MTGTCLPRRAIRGADKRPTQRSGKHAAPLPFCAAIDVGFPAATQVRRRNDFFLARARVPGRMRPLGNPTAGTNSFQMQAQDTTSRQQRRERSNATAGGSSGIVRGWSRMKNLETEMAERGWSGPHPLLAKDEAVGLAKVLESWGPAFTRPEEQAAVAFAPEFSSRPWFKSLHAYIPEMFELVSRPDIVRPLLPILGPEIVAWGAARIVRRPKQTHRWHVDVEHIRWRGLSVFVGLANSEQAGLRFVDGSHLIKETPQEAGVSSDEEAVELARTRNSAARVSEPVLPTGSMVVFDGRTWHASTNRSQTTRVGLLLQYAPSSETFAIPLNWEEPMRWHEKPPPLVRVAGSGRHSGPNVVSSVLPLKRPKSIVSKLCNRVASMLGRNGSG
jgi:Phytanoyl-CoA dioxygenase (PhyH)